MQESIGVLTLTHVQAAGRWRAVYVFGSATLLYLNVFVLVAQLFRKVPAMHDLAPTQREAPFALVQLGLLASFLVLALRANTRFRPAPDVPSR